MAVHTQNRRSSNHDKHTASHGSGKKTCGDCRGKGQVRNYSRPNGGKNYTMKNALLAVDAVKCQKVRSSVIPSSRPD